MSRLDLLSRWWADRRPLTRAGARPLWPRMADVGEAAALLDRVRFGGRRGATEDLMATASTPWPALAPIAVRESALAVEALIQRTDLAAPTVHALLNALPRYRDAIRASGHPPGGWSVATIFRAYALLGAHGWSLPTMAPDRWTEVVDLAATDADFALDAWLVVGAQPTIPDDDFRRLVAKSEHPKTPSAAGSLFWRVINDARLTAGQRRARVHTARLLGAALMDDPGTPPGALDWTLPGALDGALDVVPFTPDSSTLAWVLRRFGESWRGASGEHAGNATPPFHGRLWAALEGATERHRMDLADALWAAYAPAFMADAAEVAPLLSIARPSLRATIIFSLHGAPPASAGPDVDIAASAVSATDVSRPAMRPPTGPRR